MIHEIKPTSGEAAMKALQDDERLSALGQQSAQLMIGVPAEFNGRQRTLVERRDGYLYLQIVSSFKLPQLPLCNEKLAAQRSGE